MVELIERLPQTGSLSARFPEYFIRRLVGAPPFVLAHAATRQLNGLVQLGSEVGDKQPIQFFHIKSNVSEHTTNGRTD